MRVPASPLRADLLKTTISRLRLFLSLEWRILAIIFSYSVAIGLFTLIVPLTVQELVSTFSFAVQPIMVLQARAVEILIQRLYTRIAVAFAQSLPATHRPCRPQTVSGPGTDQELRQRRGSRLQVRRAYADTGASSVMI